MVCNGKRFIIFPLLLLVVYSRAATLQSAQTLLVDGESGANENGKRITSMYSGSLKRMLAIVNTTYQACDDYFQHACGNYGDFMANGSDSLPPFLTNAEDRMQFFFEHKEEFVTTAGRNLRSLYDQCKQRARGRTRVGAVRWERMLRQIDFLATAQMYQQWPLLPYQWEEQKRGAGNEVDQNWVQLAAQFAAHGVPTILDIFFAEQTIYIAPAPQGGDGGGAEEGWMCPSWSQIAMSLQPLCGHSVQKALIIGHELRELCGELSGEWSAKQAPVPLMSTTSAVSDEEDDEKESHVHILLDSSIVVYLASYFNVLNISAAEVEVARKVPTDVRRVAEILRVLQKTSPRTLFNYVMWRAYEQLRYEDCFQLTTEFEMILYSEYWHWHVFQRHISRDVTMALYLFHTARYFKQRHGYLSATDGWMDYVLRGRGREEQQNREKYDVEWLIRRYAHRYLRPQRLALLFGDGSLPPRHFYGNLLHMRRLLLRHTFYTPLYDAADADEPASMLREFLHFAVALLKQPLYHYFATQAFERWYAAPWLHTSDELLAMSHCLTFFTGVAPSEPAAESVYRFTGAFRAVFQDYQYWLETQSFAFAEEYFLEYFRLSTQHVLFYAVTQRYCGRFDAVFATRLNRAFAHMPEFQAAFSCSSEAAMNALWKCLSL